MMARHDDPDPAETTEAPEWREALQQLLAHAGPARATQGMDEPAVLARAPAVGWQPPRVTPYANTIPAERQPRFPGDLARSLSHALNYALGHAGRHKHRAPGLQRKNAAGMATRDALARHPRNQGRPRGLDRQCEQLGGRRSARLRTRPRPRAGQWQQPAKPCAATGRRQWAQACRHAARPRAGPLGDRRRCRAPHAGWRLRMLPATSCRCPARPPVRWVQGPPGPG
jgi:hypothetical protein